MKIELDDPSHVALVKAALVAQARSLQNIDIRAGGRPVWDDTVKLLLRVSDATRCVPIEDHSYEESTIIPERIEEHWPLGPAQLPIGDFDRTYVDSETLDTERGILSKQAN